VIILKIVTDIWKCLCGKNIIILGENLESIKLKSDEILCPICGETMESSETRTLEIVK
jgi:hypothetical protein